MRDAFHIVVMGCSGGPRESNLSGYLLSPVEKQEWIALDGGTVLAGIECALAKESLDHVPFSDPELLPAAEMFVHHVKAALLSHAHLDHITGFVVNSQIDTHKAILGIDPTIDNIRDHIFNGKIWPNYGDEGMEPCLKKYHYLRLPLHQKTSIPDTSMSVEAFLLSHPRGYPSTAFLIEYKQSYLLYFGDTSSDALEREKHLARIWRRIAPLLREGKLAGIMLECSFSHEEKGHALYGHLDTKLMMGEFHHLATLAQTSLEGLKVVVTHQKESFKKNVDVSARIQQELEELNDLGVHFIFPSQGDRILL